MQQGKTLRFLVLFLSGFLATTSSVYAFHFAAAGVQADSTPKTKVQFWFLGVSSPNLPGLVIPTQFQCTVMHDDESIRFRLFASAQENASFTVQESDVGHRITITGKLLSRIFFASHRGVRAFTEINDFKAEGVDVVADPPVSGEGNDSFVLKFTYSTKGIQSLLLDVFGADSGLVKCPDETDTCTLTLQGKVQFGDVEAHTSGGD